MQEQCSALGTAVAPGLHPAGLLVQDKEHHWDVL